MLKNKIKDRMKEGKPVFGVELYSQGIPDFVEIIGNLGFDYVTMDVEHEAVDEIDVLHQIRAAECVGVTPIVRVEKGRTLCNHFLQSRAQGIQVPRVNTVSDAREIVNDCYFHPIGKRTLYGIGPSGDYGFMDIKEYMEHSNREILLICMIEEVEGLENLAEIVKVPGIDVIHIAKWDLWQSMGMPDLEKAMGFSKSDSSTGYTKTGSPTKDSIIGKEMERAFHIIKEAGLSIQVTLGPRTDFETEIPLLLKKGVRFFNISIRSLFIDAARSVLQKMHDSF